MWQRPQSRRSFCSSPVTTQTGSQAAWRTLRVKLLAAYGYTEPQRYLSFHAEHLKPWAAKHLKHPHSVQDAFGDWPGIYEEAQVSPPTEPNEPQWTPSPVPAKWGRTLAPEKHDLSQDKFTTPCSAWCPSRDSSLMAPGAAQAKRDTALMSKKNILDFILLTKRLIQSY